MPKRPSYTTETYPDIALYITDIEQRARISVKEAIDLGPVLIAGRERESRLGKLALYLGLEDLKELADLSLPYDIRAEFADDLDVYSAAERARQLLVVDVLGDVIGIAGHHIGRGIEMSDLVQEGNLGALHATKTFAFSRMPSFRAYARMVVSGDIGHAFVVRRYKSSDKYIDEDPDLFKDIRQDDSADQPERVADTFLAGDLQRALGVLSEKRRQALCLVYGLETGAALTHEQAGNVLGIGGRGVGQRVARALEDLRQSEEAMSILRDYWED